MVFSVRKDPIFEYCELTKATIEVELTCRYIIRKDVSIKLVKVEYLLGIITHELERLLGIPLTTISGIDNLPHLSTTIRRTKIKEINGADRLMCVSELNHQAHLLICIDIVGIALDVLLEEIARIGSLTCRYHPLARVVLKMKEKIEIAKLGSSQLQSIGLKIHDEIGEF